MLMPSIFGESLFDDLFDDFVRPAKHTAAYRTPVTAVMKTDVREHEHGYELDIELPGYKKENVQAQLKDGYLTITAAAGTEDEEKKNQHDDNCVYDVCTDKDARYAGNSLINSACLLCYKKPTVVQFRILPAVGNVGL